MEKELVIKGHRKGLWLMVILQSLWRRLQNNTVGPGAMADQLLPRNVKCMMCREPQEAGDDVDQMQHACHRNADMRRD